jgi:hypothetical protein
MLRPNLPTLIFCPTSGPFCQERVPAGSVLVLSCFDARATKFEYKLLTNSSAVASSGLGFSV